MAEKEKKPVAHNKGGMSFGQEILLFVVVIFIIWVLMGGAKKEIPSTPFIVPNEGEVIPIGTYGN